MGGPQSRSGHRGVDNNTCLYCKPHQILRCFSPSRDRYTDWATPALFTLRVISKLATNWLFNLLVVWDLSLAWKILETHRNTDERIIVGVRTWVHLFMQ
jgi:hypothetical protein